MVRTDLLTSGTVHQMKSHPTLYRRAHRRAAESAAVHVKVIKTHTLKTQTSPHLELINAQNYCRGINRCTIFRLFHLRESKI